MLINKNITRKLSDLSLFPRAIIKISILLTRYMCNVAKNAKINSKVIVLMNCLILPATIERFYGDLVRRMAISILETRVILVISVEH